MKRFIVSVEETATEDQRNAITNNFKSNEWPFWHHIGNFWLLAVGDEGDDESVGAIQLRELIKSFSPDSTVFVAELTSSDWACFGPARGQKWFDEYWKLGED